MTLFTGWLPKLTTFHNTKVALFSAEIVSKFVSYVGKAAVIFVTFEQLDEKIHCFTAVAAQRISS